MDPQQQQAIERIKQANNILVTVSSNPSVDQLAACIGTTIALNKMGKHATAVFSGEVPSTIEFLQPEKTIEKNTDSLRDFIIALDRSKAEKLRYKVEDQIVRIFITPYRTSITGDDLEFSQGDFNVQVVLALGVHDQADVDQAITAHGRILHDATVLSVNVAAGPGELGAINWVNPNASSLSELCVQLVDSLDKSLLDGQIATAFLTGIVAETERFSNERTTPQTMSVSAELMTAGANQQLVATKLAEPVVVPEPEPEPAPAVELAEPAAPEEPAEKPDNGVLEISHDADETPAEPEAVPAADAEAPPQTEAPAATAEGGEDTGLPLPAPAAESPKIIHDDRKQVDAEPILQDDKKDHKPNSPRMILQPPTLQSPLTGSADDEDTAEPSSDPLSQPNADGRILNHGTPAASETAHKGKTITPPAGINDLKPPALPPLPHLEEEPEPVMQPAMVKPTAAADQPPVPPVMPELPPVMPAPAAVAEPAPALSPPAPASDDLAAAVAPFLPGDTPQLPPASTPAASPEPQTPAAPAAGASGDLQTLADLEKDLRATAPAEPAPAAQLEAPTPPDIPVMPPAAENQLPDIDQALDAALQAINSGNQPPQPRSDLNAMPLGYREPDAAAPQASGMPSGVPSTGIVTDDGQPLNLTMPSGTQSAAAGPAAPAEPAPNPDSPPPVPPPFYPMQ